MLESGSRRKQFGQAAEEDLLILIGLACRLRHNRFFNDCAIGEGNFSDSGIYPTAGKNPMPSAS
jgi:hypothetical protein